MVNQLDLIYIFKLHPVTTEYIPLPSVPEHLTGETIFWAIKEVSIKS